MTVGEREVTRRGDRTKDRAPVLAVVVRWLTALGLAGIPIDHALHSPDLAVVSRTTGPAVGSPHRSVRVTFAPAAPAATRRGE